MNLLFTINKNYLKYLITLLRSLEVSNEGNFHVYIISNDVKKEDLFLYQEYIEIDRYQFTILSIQEDAFDKAPVTKRYPLVIYYRIFASKLLPTDVDRILYLDPDIIILKDLHELYQMDFEGNYYIASTNVQEPLRKLNEIKNKAPKNSPYPNSGVMLMNLELLRKYQNEEEVYEYIRKNKSILFLPDQDIFHGLYGNKIKIIDHMKYNLSDRAIRRHNIRSPKHPIYYDWVDKNCYIIHYYGKNKPWLENYHGILNVYYQRFQFQMVEKK